MMTTFKQEKLIYKLLTLAVLAAAVFFVARTLYAGILALPYPKELLEPSNVALTEQFIKYGSPYSLSSLNWEVPGANYDYPFLNSVVAAFVATVTGCTSVKAHFFISVFSIIGSGVLGFIMVKDMARTTVTPCLTAIVFMFCHWRFGYISASPDDPGLFLFLLTMYVAVCPKIKHKPLLCAIGITLCFYTKQYFVFIAPGLFIYMFLYSRKEAFKLLIWSIVINIVIGVLITTIWPLYWTKAFLFTYLGTAVGGGSQLSTLIDQFKYLIVLFAALFAVLIVSVSIAVGRMIRRNEKLKNIRFRENDVLTCNVVQMIVMMIPLFYIGRNDGAFISYFLQLWMPSVVIVTLLCYEKLISEKHEMVYACIYALIALCTIYFGFTKLPNHILTAEEIEQWDKALKYTADYSKDGEIYYSRGLVYDGFMRGNGDWQCGHEGEVDVDTISRLESAGLPAADSYYIRRLVDQNVKYRKEIVDKAAKHKYFLITFEVTDHFTCFNEENCKELGYKRIDLLELQIGNMPYKVAFYAR